MPHISLLTQIEFILPLVLIVFWIWMFRDMLNNDRLPNGGPLNKLTSDPKSDWTIAFIFLNVFAAVFYFSLVYRHKK
jgi:hypothetical protein